MKKLEAVSPCGLWLSSVIILPALPVGSGQPSGCDCVRIATSKVNALVRRGFRIRLYEQASHYIPRAGAGFGFSPNGQVSLASIGIDSRPPLHHFNWMIHLNRDGKLELESDFFAKIREKYGFRIGGCLRADLVDTLSQSLAKSDGDCLQYSHRLVLMDQDHKTVRLQFDGRNEVEHDIVIGADGIHSKVAELLHIDHSPPVYSNANIFYGVIEDPDKIDFVDRLLAQDHALIHGNNVGECITFRAGPNDKKVQIWAITYPCTAPPAREEWGAADPSSRELTSIISRFPSSHPFRELASHTTSGRLLHFGLFFRKHKDRWAKGRTCLLGDSCHATLPYVGQGANQAIEDAIVLAESISGCKDHDEAFKLYFERRSRRTKRVVQMANLMDKLYHTQNPLLTTMRDFLFASFFKGGLLSKAIEKEIVEECPIPVKDFAKYQ